MPALSSHNLAQNNEKKRIARFLLPDVDPQSSILPSDKWVAQNAVGIFKTNKTVKNETLATLGYGALTLGSLTTTIAFAIVTFPAVAVMAVVCCFGFGVSALFAQKTRAALNTLKENALPELQGEIGGRYIKLQAEEIGAAWQVNLAQRARGSKEETSVSQEAPAQKNKASFKKGLGKWAFKQAFSRKETAAVKSTRAQNPPAP